MRCIVICKYVPDSLVFATNVRIKELTVKCFIKKCD